jgi:hypothetical protein
MAGENPQNSRNRPKAKARPRGRAFFRITEEMFDRVHGHHHPDHLAGAANAPTKRPTGGESKPLRSLFSWSEWQDLNLRPPVPNEGRLPGAPFRLLYTSLGVVTMLWRRRDPVDDPHRESATDGRGMTAKAPAGTCRGAVISRRACGLSPRSALH